MKVISNAVWGAVALVASATVGQVWYTLTPAVASQETLEEHVRYIRNRVDELYKMEIERNK